MIEDEYEKRESRLAKFLNHSIHLHKIPIVTKTTRVKSE